MPVLKEIKKAPFSGVYPDKGGRESLSQVHRGRLGMRCKGDMLIESMIATVLLMICFAIGSGVFVNALAGGDNFRNFNASVLLKNTAEKIKKDKDFIDGSFKTGDNTIEKSFSKYRESSEGNKLWVLHLKLYDANKELLSQYKEIILQ